MLFLLLLSTLAPFWLSAIKAVTATKIGDVALRAHNGDENTVVAIGKALRAARLHARDTTYTMNETSFAKNWTGATLFSTEISSDTNTGNNTSLGLDSGIAIICATCYVNGSVSGELTVRRDFNVTEVVEDVGNELKNVTGAALDELENYVKQVAENISTFHLSDMPAWPTLDVDFNLANTTTGLPSVQAQFEFDALELYLDLDLKLSAGATYTLNLFTSETPAGFEIPDLEAGAIFSVSLILIAEAEVDISSGIHIKLDDGLALNMELFEKNVSQITLPGATFELLPITIDGQGSIRALLQLEARVGFELSSPEVASLFSASAGVEADVFAYLADVLVQVNGSSIDGCELAAAAEYTLAVGGAAGATIAIETYQWGPTPNTTIPVWYTTLGSICADSKTTTTTPTVSNTATAADVTARAGLEHRDALVTTTVSTTELHTIVNCLSSGLVNCPVNRQNTTSVKQTLTSVLTVPSGVDATYPPNTYASITSAIPFGTNLVHVSATTGIPTSYVPPQPTSSAHDGGSGSGSSSGSSNGGGVHENHDKLIIGLTVGLGVPFLVVITAGLWLVFKRQVRPYAQHPETTVNKAGSPNPERGDEKMVHTKVTTSN